jgi:hypothetical protein
MDFMRLVKSIEIKNNFLVGQATMEYLIITVFLAAFVLMAFKNFDSMPGSFMHKVRFDLSAFTDNANTRMTRPQAPFVQPW